ncbi:hypothetical protein LIER_24549 [Lithospermum erythrorhizon]|uniref:Uncharacterized protein n=1 Tax=Lithospermum erythrorhizon TaxID=34254 RepID=A0AAV3R7D7_LITER
MARVTIAVIAVLFIFVICSSIGEARNLEETTSLESIQPTRDAISKHHEHKQCCRYCQKYADCDHKCKYHFCWAGAGARATP